MTVIDKLARCENSGYEFGTIDNRIKAAFQQANEVFAGIALDPNRFGINAFKLLFGNIAVIAFKLLLGAQLGAEIRQFTAAALAMLTRAVITAVYRALRATPNILAQAAVNFILRRKALAHAALSLHLLK
jgi:hypothetical protein